MTYPIQNQKIKNFIETGNVKKILKLLNYEKDLGASIEAVFALQEMDFSPVLNKKYNDRILKTLIFLMSGQIQFASGYSEETFELTLRIAQASRKILLELPKLVILNEYNKIDSSNNKILDYNFAFLLFYHGKAEAFKIIASSIKFDDARLGLNKYIFSDINQLDAKSIQTAVENLLKAETDWCVQLQALFILLYINKEEAVDKLKQKLLSGDWQTSPRAAKILYYFGWLPESNDRMASEYFVYVLRFLVENSVNSNRSTPGTEELLNFDYIAHRFNRISETDLDPLVRLYGVGIEGCDETYIESDKKERIEFAKISRKILVSCGLAGAKVLIKFLDDKNFSIIGKNNLRHKQILWIGEVLCEIGELALEPLLNILSKDSIALFEQKTGVIKVLGIMKDKRALPVLEEYKESSVDHHDIHSRLIDEAVANIG